MTSLYSIQILPLHLSKSLLLFCIHCKLSVTLHQTWWLLMRGSRSFVKGGGGGGGESRSIWHKKLWQRFFSPAYFTVISKKTIIFQGSRGSNILQGCPTLSRGSNCLFPIETHITRDFPGGPDPLSPLWIHPCSWTSTDLSVTKFKETKSSTIDIFQKKNIFFLNQL